MQVMSVEILTFKKKSNIYTPSGFLRQNLTL